MLYILARRVADFINPPSAIDVAKRELEDARRELLEWEKAKEDADAMVVSLQQRIKRLHGYTADEVVARSLHSAVGKMVAVYDGDRP